MTIKEAAQNLKINYSTAKHIVKVYKRTGEMQTQMMNKRLPERDIYHLEALGYKNPAFLHQGDMGSGIAVATPVFSAATGGHSYYH